MLQQCIKQHGVAWLYPPMQHLLTQMAIPPSLDGLDRVATPQFVSFELWTRPNARNSGEVDHDDGHVASTSSASRDGDAPLDGKGRGGDGVSGSRGISSNLSSPQLVAGDLGCIVGSCYTSFSGFHEGSGTGSIQLVLTGKLLERAGFGMWDLGQEHAYKSALGASSVPRRDFLALFRQLRCMPNRLRDVVGDGGDATVASSLRQA